MIHPNNILRSSRYYDVDADHGADSDEIEFEAPLGAIRRPGDEDNVTDLDCGCAPFPALTRWLRLERLARPVAFSVVLCLIAMAQGALVVYFRDTVHAWQQHYNLPDSWIRLLLYSNDMFNAQIALFASHTFKKTHRPVWIGSLAIYLSVSSLMLIIPEAHLTDPSIQSTLPELCAANVTTAVTKPSDDAAGINYIALVIFCMYQLVHSFSSIAVMTHGITYIDDHINEVNSGIYVSILIASNEIGKQIGMYLSWIVVWTESGIIFISAAWITTACVVAVLGMVMNMFPRALPSAIIRRSVENLLQYASAGVMESSPPIAGASDDVNNQGKRKRRKTGALFRRVLSLVRNRLLVANVSCVMFVSLAAVTFNLFENDYYRARYFVHLDHTNGAFHAPRVAQLFTNAAKQPTIALTLILTGFVLSWARPHARNLARATAVAYALAAICVVGGHYAIGGCTEGREHIMGGGAGVTEYRQYCQVDCACASDVFMPVCVNGTHTYFSPCHAACRRSEIGQSGQTLYLDCSCAPTSAGMLNAEAGACAYEKCQFFYGLAQINGILIQALISVALLGQLLITLRAVAKVEKSLALGFQAMCVGSVAALGQLIYTNLTEIMCAYMISDKGCKLHTEKFSEFIAILTMAFLLAAAALAVMVSLLVGHLQLYKNNAVYDEDEYIESFQRDLSRRNSSEIVLGEMRSGDDNGGGAVVTRSPTHQRYYETESFLGSDTTYMPSSGSTATTTTQQPSESGRPRRPTNAKLQQQQQQQQQQQRRVHSPVSDDDESSSLPAETASPATMRASSGAPSQPQHYSPTTYREGSVIMTTF